MPGTRRDLRRRAARRRTLTIILSATLVVALAVGYALGDIAGILPGPLTLDPVARRDVPAARTVRGAGIVAEADDAAAPDAAAVQRLVDAFGATDGVGDDWSVVVTDRTGATLASHAADTPREPASTLKTLTALAAASTLDMGSTLATETYLTQGTATPTLTLKGNGDMLLSAGESDPSHVNGRAGLATLARDTATALAQRGIGTVRLVYDDTLFGTDRYPATVADNNPDNLYYTAVSALAVDGGRQWGGAEPADPDLFHAYPTLSQTPALDAADTFATLLAAAGITVDGSPASGSAPADASPIAAVESATLSEIMAFTMRHSDNTLAEEFGRLTALATGEANSPQGGVAAVRKTLTSLGIDLTGLTMADCSGLSTGSKVRVSTLAAVQARNLTAAGAAAAAEGLSIPGLVGTAATRAVADDTAGLLRVKTGSLGEVTSMAGTVTRLAGGTLVFAVVVNTPDDMAEARAAIDTFVDDLARL
ncbi:D-alanyl-D-alanine carboxypeptidase/D-alanyl-D-alanine-endopeptidase [Bifidobacterium samirii]|nr:D-alanyl-D-alanine carboxypeptidase [Bifidobacterium samirii]